MLALDIKPGPQIGELLQKLFDEVDEDLTKNTKEYLLKKVKELTICNLYIGQPPNTTLSKSK